jgi:probable DNA repair protein
MRHCPEIAHKDVWPLLEGGAALVTATQRLSRRIAAEYAERQLEAGITAWETPDILAYSAWVRRLYESLLTQQDQAGAEPWPDPLPEEQELWVWRAVISASGPGESLLQVTTAAKTAREALAICRQWRLGRNELAEAPPPDTRAFIEWRRHFERRAEAENWVEAARLPDLVAEGIRRRLILLPDRVILAGFDVYAPQVAALMEAIQAAGKTVCRLSRPQPADRISGLCLADTESEIIEAAKWARDRLEAGPGARIGVIVPDLSAVRRRLTRIFDDVLHPGLVYEAGEAADPAGQRAYAVSLGPPLADYPMIEAALTVLGAASPGMPAETAGRILLSPFLGRPDEDLPGRGRADAGLRKRGELEVSWSLLMETVEEAQCPGFLRLLRGFQQAARGLFEAVLPPSRWAEGFGALLEALSWPAGRPLSSPEYQCLDAWHEALGRFSDMDRVMGAISQGQALQELTRLLSETPFQPEAGDRPIQVMGVLESAGEAFDAAWIMGLDNEHWPPPPSPNPLLPVWLQRKYHVAHASPERELAYAKEITERLLGCAQEVVVSYPGREGDAQRFASPLIRRFVRDEILPQAAPGPALWSRMPDPEAVECMADAKGPEVESGGLMPGGTGILKSQADCPFQAFARYRLGAEPLERPAPGLDAAARGTLVHRSLELLWQEIRTHALLVSMPAPEVERAIEAAAGRAAAEMAGDRPATFTRRFEAIEKERLVDLLQEWLACERERAPFSVQERERRSEVAIAGIRLHTAADRIDRLEGEADPERLVLIDYKTSTPRLSDWFSDRLAEPQLPLYAISLEAPLAAVLFGQVRKGDCRFIGVAEDPETAPGARQAGGEENEDCGGRAFAHLLQHWRSKLEALAGEIQSGHAAVAPRSAPESCRYCDLKPLCRIHEYFGLEPEHAPDF